jgi:hypothetical protein
MKTLGSTNCFSKTAPFGRGSVTVRFLFASIGSGLPALSTVFPTLS